MADNNLIPFSQPPADSNLPARNTPGSFDFSRGYFVPEVDSSAASAPLSHYLWILRRRWWQISLFVALVVGATLAISLRLVPIY